MIDVPKCSHLEIERRWRADMAAGWRMNRKMARFLRNDAIVALPG
jgi:hypothetical protein